MQSGEEEHRGWSYLIIGLLLVAIWHLFAVLLNSIALPTPLAVFCAFISGIKDELLAHLLISAIRVGCGILLALSLAVPLGLVSYKNRADKIVAPLIYLLYPIPHIVLLPLVILLFGIGNFSKIILIAIIVFFQILVTTRDAARNLSMNYIYSLLSLGASEKDIYKHVILPASLPKILTAMRISIGTAIAVLFFVESFATTKGLGYLIMDAWSRMDYPDLYAAIVTMALLGFCLYMMLEKVEHKVCAWVYV
ncbi:MAG: ABC transporter permease [Methanophagales archaeon]|nr:ABC transporter permease [Methanophagales archaeon]MCW3141978.1 ABC transporter permease [Methanophagales archaeon]